MMSMKSHLINIFLFLYEPTLLRNWNQSNRIIQTKVTAFSCQTSRFTRITLEHFVLLFFRGLNLIFGTISLYSFKAKVLRVLLRLESPNSEHRNSSYVRNHPDYSMFKAGTRIWLAHGPTLSEFLGHLGSEFGDSYSLSLVLLEVYFTEPLESLISDKK